MTYYCVIKQCSVEGCGTWYVGTPRSRYCDPHKRSNYERMRRAWERAKANGGTSKRSRFSKDEIEEIRWMFYRHTAKEIAEHFNCNPSLIYRYVHQDPIRYRV